MSAIELGGWLPALVNACWQSALAMITLWALWRAAPRFSPQWRCWLWRLAYLKMLCALFWPGGLQLPLLPPAPSSLSATQPEKRDFPSAKPEALQKFNSNSPAAPLEVAVPTVTNSRFHAAPPFNLETGLLALWLAGVSWCCAQIAREWMRARAVSRVAQPLADASLLDEYAALCWQFEVRRVPRLMEVSGNGSPMLLGVWKPMVVLPRDLLPSCTRRELHLMLAHELAHFKRRDLWWNWLLALGQALFFFHPLAWVGAREWHIAQEMSCDELALEVSQARPAEYGGVLLKIAGYCRPQPQPICATVAVVESYLTLKTRLLAITERGKEQYNSRSLAIAMSAASVLMLLPWHLAQRSAQAAPGIETIGAAQPDLGVNASLHGGLLFPADNAWNQRIDTAPIDKNSAVLLQSIGANQKLMPGFGGAWHGKPFGTPYIVVGNETPGVAVSFNIAAQSDAGPYPIPGDIAPDVAQAQAFDEHIVVLHRDEHKLYEIYHAEPSRQGYHAVCGAIFDLKSNALRPAGWTSATGSGLPIFPGLTRCDEVLEQGAIHHALSFSVQRTRRAYVSPARHYASDANDPALPPMGMRVRLKGAYDISQFPPQARVILEALKKYGMIVASNGQNWLLSGTADARWNNDDLNTLKRITGKDFEVVQMNAISTDMPFDN